MRLTLALAALMFAADPAHAADAGTPQAQSSTFAERKVVARNVLGDTEDVWTAWFKVARSSSYAPATLVLFDNRVDSVCGTVNAAMGAFYCPDDRRMYFDAARFDELLQRHGASADFLQAYMIAHSVGHHVQNLLGTIDAVESQSRDADARRRNDLTLRLELQADCYAGVWAFWARERHLLDSVDFAATVSAVAAQRADAKPPASGISDHFAHGTATMRTRWFNAGFERGDPAGCDTFAAGKP